ncbi:MAG: AMP-binding protein [Gemmatimonadetes bacterium]|nr:AMP-binding protein [Gemmatimonadota bacterium]
MGLLSVSAMIREFYQDRTVLLTGGTGFYGQGLTAKILRYLPGVRRLYLVLRPGRGTGGTTLPVEERLDELFKLVVFDRFRQEEPDAFAAMRQKVRALACDMRQPGLGLDEASREELLAEVDLIIGNAASVTFDEPLDSAIQFNTLAPQELLRLAREGRKKPVLVHVSTAYVNGRLTGAVPERTLPVDRTIQHLIDGSAPPQPFVPEEEIAQAQARCRAICDQAQSEEQQRAFRREIVEQSHRRTLSDSRLQKLIDDRCRRWIERELVEEGMRRARQHGWNDVYTFTKAMGEQLLVKHRGQVPLAIVRPSVTEGALEDPHPGWIHGLKVTDPLIVAYGRGIVPDFPAAMGAPMDLVPVDIVVNTVLAAATQATASTVEVFHAATSGENPLPNTRMFKYVKGYFEEHPLLNKDGSRPELVDWTFPTVERFQRAFNWKYLYPLEMKQKLYECLPERWAPAQKKRRLAALKTRLKRVQYFTDLFSPYTTLDCRYEAKRMLALYESLPPEEQRIFNMDVRRIDWYQYYQKTHLPGLRRHELGGSDDDQEPLSAAPSEVGGEEQRWRIEESIRTIPDLLRWACGRYAAKTALQIERQSGWTRISYDELLTRAERVARGWRAQGVATGERVLLCGDNGPEWVVAYMAASLLGLAVVPISPQMRDEDIWRLCDFVQARALIAAEKRFSQLSPEGVAAHKEMAFFNVDRDGLPFGHAPEPAASAKKGRWKRPRVNPDATASIVFTSVIEPRGVVLSHRNLISNVLAQGEVLRIYESDRMLSTLPLHQALEFTGGLLLPLLGGATITYLESVNSREMLRTLRDTNATVLLTAPRLLRVLADRVERLGAEATTGLAALRRVVSVGAALSDDLVGTYERLGVAICQGYGLSEAASVVAVNTLMQRKTQSVGQVLPGQQVQIAEPDERGVGEVLVRGANVMEGYFSQEELTQAVLRDEWLRTGDLGRLDDNGYLFVEGRSKDLIVNGAGHNVYPREVESLYHDLPHVAELSVVGVPSAHTGSEEVHGIAVLTSEAEQAEDLREAIQARSYEISRTLPSHHRIQHLHFWTRPLPRLDDGTVDRQALLSAIEREDCPGTPLPEWERAIQRQIGLLAGLSTGEVAAHLDTPLDTLLDSLMAVEFAAWLGQRLGTQVDGLLQPQDTLRSVLARLEAHLQDGVDWEVEQSPAYWSSILHAEPSAEPESEAGKNMLQEILWETGGPLFRRFFDFRAGGLEHLPQDRPYLIAANHASHLDGACVYAAVHSHVDHLNIATSEHYLTDSELRWFLYTFVNAIPFDGHDNFAVGLVRARQLVGARRPLLVFPEGARSVNGQLQPFKASVGLLAYELDAPVVPLHIAGTREALPKGTRTPSRHPLRLLFGLPLETTSFKEHSETLSPYEIYYEIAAALKRQIEALGRKNI